MPNLSEQRHLLANKPVRPSLNSCLSVVVVALSVVPLGLFIFSLTGRYFFIAELANNFRCQIMCLLIPFALILLLLRRWRLAILFGIATAWSMIGIVWVFLPGLQPPRGSSTIKIMSANVYASNPTPQLAVQRILEYDPDLVMLIEFANDWEQVMQPLHARYPFRVLQPRWHGFGIGLFSKLPLAETEIHQLAGSVVDCPMIITHLKLGQQNICVAGLHTLSPTNPIRMELRNQQLVESARILRTINEPTIVMGDFNCTPWSPFLSDFIGTTGFRDSRQGFGFQATWHRDFGIFKIPIDHAFVSDGIFVHHRSVGAAIGSDHLPIMLEVSARQLPNR